MDDVVDLQPTGAVTTGELAVPVPLADQALQPFRHLAGGAADADVVVVEHPLDPAVAGALLTDRFAQRDTGLQLAQTGLGGHLDRIHIR